MTGTMILVFHTIRNQLHDKADFYQSQSMTLPVHPVLAFTKTPLFSVTKLNCHPAP